MAHKQLIDTELPIRPDVTSTSRPWAGITVQIHHWRGPGSAVSPELDHDILAMRYLGHSSLEQRRMGQVHRSLVVPGNLGLHPRGVMSRWKWDRPGSIVISRIPPSMLAEAANATIRRDRPDYTLRNCFGARDVFAETILNLLAREITVPEHPTQTLLAEHLSCALASHLVHRFNADPVNPCGKQNGLRPSALSRVLDYMHNSADANVNLQDLATIAQVSRFHFARMFKGSTGQSPMAYLERIRLFQARELLYASGHTVTTVAFMVGFSDQSHFCRRFKHHFGVSPGSILRRNRT